VTGDPSTPAVLEGARWFGPVDDRLFAWLTWPDTSSVRGGVILTQPIGREARAARRAMRILGIELAKRGFVALRVDYPGTGDSSGSLDEIDLQYTWVEAMTQATAYLGSMGVKDVSGVGMRLGATVIALANTTGLSLSSLVLWDPCETGRNFLREVGALESLRRADFEAPSDGSVATSEWVFSPSSVEQIRGLDLLKSATEIHAQRLLVITREDRAFPERLRQRLEGRHVDWEVTSEQGAMLDVEPLHAVMATSTIGRIAAWLDSSAVPALPFRVDQEVAGAVVHGRRGEAPVKETFVHLGRRGLFGIVSQPTGEPRGPLVVFFNTANEEHIGTSRLWVELSRQWSADGIRCLRFDVSGVGDSPNFASPPSRLWYESEWLEDIDDVVREMRPEDASNVILIGLCSGAFLAAEGALAFDARAACLLNPPVGNDLLHAAATFRRSRVSWVRSMAEFLRMLHIKGPWLGTGFWLVLRAFLPRRYSQDLISTVAKRGTRLLVLASTDDISPHRTTPLLRNIDRHRIEAPRNYEVQFVPGLDHSMHVAKGREAVVAILDAFVRECLTLSTPRNAPAP